MSSPRKASNRNIVADLLVDDNGALFVAAGGYRSSVVITRPVNVTPYAAGDVIGQADAGVPANAGIAALELANMGAAGAHLLVTTADLRIDAAAVPAGMGSMRALLFDQAPTAILDNEAWAFPAGDRAKFLGYIDLPAPADLGATLYTQNDAINKHVKLADGATSLYVLLQTIGGFTPAANSEVYTLRLRALPI